MIKHLNIKIYGLVQGVFFRHSARLKALEFKLVGFIKNQPDGSVYLEVEGDENNLKYFLSWCYQGPSSARVNKVESEFTDKIKGYHNFEIID